MCDVLSRGGLSVKTAHRKGGSPGSGRESSQWGSELPYSLRAGIELDHVKVCKEEKSHGRLEMASWSQKNYT